MYYGDGLGGRAGQRVARAGGGAAALEMKGRGVANGACHGGIGNYSAAADQASAPSGWMDCPGQGSTCILLQGRLQWSGRESMIGGHRGRRVGIRGQVSEGDMAVVVVAACGW